MKDTAAAPTAELMSAIERVRRLSHHQSRLIQDRFGISIYQVGVLAAVEDGARQLGEVAHATGQQVSSASRLVERLVQDGLLERDADTRDRRAVVIGLTAAGRAMLAGARQLVGATMQQAISHMPAEQAAQLMPALGAFLDAADAVLDEQSD
jgi:DNA-binding MarR family transcriptional regulator